MRSNLLFEQAVRQQVNGEDDAARRTYRKLISREPKHAAALSNLALLLAKAGDFTASDQMFERALLFAPKSIDIHMAQFKACMDTRRYDRISAIADKVLTLDPTHFEATLNYGVAFARQFNFPAAEPWLRKAVALRPDDVEAVFNLANCVWTGRRAFDEACEIGERALSLNPDHVPTLGFLGTLYYMGGKPLKGIERLARAVQLDKTAINLNNLGNAYIFMGEISAAVTCIINACALEPTMLALRSNLLFALNYDYEFSAEDIFAEYRSYDAVSQSLVRGRYTHDARPAISGRRIRVGISSADFKMHACLFFLEPLLRSMDKTKFELFAYSNNSDTDDARNRYKQLFDHWHDVNEMDAEEMAKLVVDDNVDILIDLAGHSHGNRLLVFQMKPAPIQASYLGFGYTTGLEAIDYFIGDEVMTPEGCEHLFSEQIIRMDGPVFCYDPLSTIPDIMPSPALRNGFITFGSLSRVVRMNDPLLMVWKHLMDRVPNSRLILDQPTFNDDDSRAYFATKLTRLGFAPERVILRSSKPHWESYHDIDISLDCWPHNVGTTAIESLWMGVPILSKRDRPSVGRVAGVFNKAVGLEDWNVDTIEEYIDKAVAVSQNPQALAELRMGLRNRVRQSRLMDYPGFARQFEGALITMVENYNRERGIEGVQF